MGVQGHQELRGIHALPMIMLGLDAEPDLDAHHTIPYSTLDEMNRISFDEYLNNRIPEFGAGLISWPTHADPSLAPEGHHCLNMIAFAPYEPVDGDWDRKRKIPGHAARRPGEELRPQDTGPYRRGKGQHSQ